MKRIDWMSVGGLIFGLGMITWGMHTGGAVRHFFNLHGITLVIGGTLAAVMINSNFEDLFSSFKAFLSVFLASNNPPAHTAIPALVNLARKARRDGFDSILGEGKHIGDGFLARSIQTLLESEDNPQVARWLLEKEINRIAQRHREVQNIFRTAGILSPMFGLIGTLVGIIQVLRNLSDPHSLGPSMSVAITSAFYGIFMANFVCVPVAGKLRNRTLNELLLKEILMEGVLAIHAGESPSSVEGRLSTYLSNRQDLAGARPVAMPPPPPPPPKKG